MKRFIGYSMLLGLFAGIFYLVYLAASEQMPEFNMSPLWETICVFMMAFFMTGYIALTVRIIVDG